MVYGVIVTIAGFTASDADIDKAEGVNINLWTGLGMLLLGLFFLAWLKLGPRRRPPAVEDDRGDASAPTPGGPGPASSSEGVTRPGVAGAVRPPVPPQRHDARS